MSVVKVTVGGHSIGIADLEDIFQEVRAAGLSDGEQLKDLILDKVRAKNYIPSKAMSVYREDLYEEYLVFTGESAKRRSSSSAPEVRLFGAGCAHCEKIDGMIKDILARRSLGVDYQYVTDMREIIRAGIMETPALVVNGSKLLSGRVPADKELERMLLAAINERREGRK